MPGIGPMQIFRGMMGGMGGGIGGGGGGGANGSAGKPNFPIERFFGPAMFKGGPIGGPFQQQAYGRDFSAPFGGQPNRYSAAGAQNMRHTQGMMDWQAQANQQMRDWWKAQGAQNNQPTENALQPAQQIQGPQPSAGQPYPIDAGAPTPPGIPGAPPQVSGPQYARRPTPTVPVTVNGPQQIDPVQMAIDYIMKTMGTSYG